MWDAQSEALAASGYRVLAPDLRGYGQTSLGQVGEPPLAAMERYADDLAEMLDALELSGPVVFVGFSMGGYIAWQFLRRHADRVRAMVLIDTRAADDADEARKMRHKMADHVVEWGAERVAEAMLPKLFAAGSLESSHPMVAHTRAVICATDPRSIAAAQRGMAARPDVTAELSRITLPTLAIVGEEDALSPVDEMRGMAEAIAGAQLAVIPAAGHLSPVEQPELVSAALKSFLERL
jgi:pimeloyl-ACP methyl ester carboxylesterase